MKLPFKDIAKFAVASLDQRLQERYPDALGPAIEALRQDPRTKMFLFGDANSKEEVGDANSSRMKWIYLKKTFEMSADPIPPDNMDVRDEMFSILMDRFSRAADKGKFVDEAIETVREYAHKIKRGDFGNKPS